ncbi:hypothetical protein HYQ03_gp08 [Arthrobacter phage Kuleana]|uniref:Uncharacterized protein n=1 Tax=Arthrobacter phage Kuleana TaxID=2653270 RepID=A0A5Q2WDK2_9CAUD|nr:hypothetical protein HYQ03_gp08 [Arthrobacter phage Kuleana]QGH74495.1 hypothetical protein SEA_KULEANA_8 [Arthrobacter phage Kuleana]
MALKKYNVTVNGFATVLQLDERGAKARGLTDRDLVGAVSAAPPAPETPAAPKAKAPANKSRTAANK